MRSGVGSAQALIVGGGIVGLCTALELARAGFKVTLIERDALARQASWAGGGLLSPLYPWRVPDEVWALSAESMAIYPQLCETLRTETGIDPEWTPSGLHLLDADALEIGLAWARMQGVRADEVSTTIGSSEPRAVLHLPWVAQVRNPRLCQAMAAHLKQLGVVLVEHAGPVQIAIQSGRASVLGHPCEWQGDVIVVAAGAWSTELLAPTGWALPIRPVKGQMLLLRGESGQVPGLLLREGRYLIPRRDGRVLVGSTIEEAGFDARTSIEALESLRDFANDLVPACRHMTVESQWAGLRPGTPDGVPLIARHEAISNLYLNAGHYRYGLTMAPASARRVVSLLE